MHHHQTYADTRDRFIDQVRALTDEQTTAIVPASPQWSTKDVVAHLSGLVAELLAGVTPPLGSDEATTRQVSDRRDMTTTETCDEWASNAAAVNELLEAKPVVALSLLADLIVHIHDVSERFGWRIDPDDDATAAGASRYLAPLQERVAERLDVALTIELTNGVTAVPPNPKASHHVTLRASPFDFLRGVTGRRTRTQVAALDWSADPSEIIEHTWRQYGQFVKPG